LFGVADLATHALIGQKSIIMAAVSASCIMPPLATSLAVLVFPTKFDQEAKSAGYVNFLLGATHITEGTIPFVAKRPQINIPVMMVGSVITCILSLVFGCATAAPHGGFLVIALVDR
jgi:fructose-specific phosphotransferase system IIC component